MDIERRRAPWRTALGSVGLQPPPQILVRLFAVSLFANQHHLTDLPARFARAKSKNTLTHTPTQYTYRIIPLSPRETLRSDLSEGGCNSRPRRRRTSRQSSSHSQTKRTSRSVSLRSNYYCQEIKKFLSIT